MSYKVSKTDWGVVDNVSGEDLIDIENNNLVLKTISDLNASDIDDIYTNEFSFSGVKTLSEPPKLNGGRKYKNKIFLKKIIDIGPWNIVADATPPAAPFLHGLDASKIRSVVVIIYGDKSYYGQQWWLDKYINFSGSCVSTFLAYDYGKVGMTVSYNYTNIILTKTQYWTVWTSTDYTRGKIVITYVGD